MGQADDIKVAILSSVKAPKEVEKLTSTIQSTLELLNTLGRPKVAQITLHPNTSHEEVREAWLISDYKPYGQQWLDISGTLWSFHFGEEFTVRAVDLVALPAGVVNFHIHTVESFKASLLA